MRGGWEPVTHSVFLGPVAGHRTSAFSAFLSLPSPTATSLWKVTFASTPSQLCIPTPTLAIAGESSL